MYINNFAVGIAQILNFSLLILGIGGFIMFVIVLFKLNKALNIWLEKNKRN